MEMHQILALKQGDYKMFKFVFDTFWGKVYSYLKKQTRDPEVAKDLTQLVFIKLWKYRESISEEISLDEQLFRKSKQVFIDWFRYELRRQSCRLSDNMAENIPSADTGSKFEISSEIFTAIRTLPPKRKEIFELKHIYGYSYQEIAELLNISVKTVDNQLLKANIQLRRMLQASMYAYIAGETFTTIF